LRVLVLPLPVSLSSTRTEAAQLPAWGALLPDGSNRPVARGERKSLPRARVCLAWCFVGLTTKKGGKANALLIGDRKELADLQTKDLLPNLVRFR